MKSKLASKDEFGKGGGEREKEYSRKRKKNFKDPEWKEESPNVKAEFNKIRGQWLVMSLQRNLEEPYG